MAIKERIAKLRELMERDGIDIYMVPTADFHNSEYVGEHFKARVFMSGFTGSAGTLVVTKDYAGLWTDGRYFLQAEQQLEGSGIELCRMFNPGVPTTTEFIEKNIPEGGVLGFDGRVVTFGEGKTLSEKLKNMPMAELILANGEPYGEKGRIEAVTGQINPATGSVQFRVSLPNPQKLLSNGNSGSIRIPKYYDNVLVLPESATYEQQGLVYVYKVEKDTANNAVIEVVDRVDNMVIIKEGVTKGETIVAEGVASMKPKTAVKPQPKSLDEIVNAIKPIF